MWNKIVKSNTIKTTLFKLLLLIWIENANLELHKRDESHRLPSALQPLQYNLVIEPNLQNPNQATFNGSVDIKIKVVEETNLITIHVRDLSILESSVKVLFLNKSTVKVNYTETDNVRNFYRINLVKKIPRNEIVQLSISNFSGELKFDNVGFYLAKYQEMDKEEILALTDFQPTGARKAFPCFDEPALKAVFFISIIRRSNFISLSNGELINTTHLGHDRYKDDFKETVLMSTYIVAFSVSKYKHTTKNGHFQIYGRSSIILQDEARYLLSVAPNLLNALENFTTVGYGLSKLDLFAVPTDYFEPGGMENWGLVTISEANLEFTNESTTEEIQKHTTLIAHEIAHQWFGNLITPSWWNYYWLSEGFCTYLEYYITSLVNPTWETIQYFVVNLQHNILLADGVSTQHLNYNPQYAGKLPSSMISYYKGAVIIKMLEHVLTPNVFQLGVTIYLEQNKFSSVSPDDLYEALQQAVNRNNYTKLQNMTVKEIMRSWESNPGYPILNVTRNYTDSSIIVCQENCGKDLNKNQRTWIIPINYLCSNENKNFNDTFPDLWLTNTSRTIYNVPPNCSWVIFNKQQTGYYRVNYDMQNWHSLIAFLKTPNFKHIHVLNRAQLIDDAFQLANLKALPYQIALNLSIYLHQETHHIPITSFLNNIKEKYIYFAYTKKVDVFLRYLEHVLSGVYKHLGFDPKSSDTHLEKLSRANVITWLCNLDNPDCQLKSLVRLKNWVQNGVRISKDVEFPVLCSALKISTAEDWNYVYQKFTMETNSNRRTRLFSSLGCTRNETLLNKFLDILLDPSATLTSKVRKAALEKILYLDSVKAEMIFDYFMRHQSSTNNMFLKIQLPDVLCRNIVRQDPTEFLFLVDPLKFTRSLMQPCLNRINKNVGIVHQPDGDFLLNWLENNLRHFLNK